MEGFLNRYADGSAGLLGRWYARAHASRCGPCAAFLAALIENRRRLLALRDSNLDLGAVERLRGMVKQLNVESE